MPSRFAVTSIVPKSCLRCAVAHTALFLMLEACGGEAGDPCKENNDCNGSLICCGLSASSERGTCDSECNTAVPDAGEVDSGVVDAGDTDVLDAGEVDSGVVDAGDTGVLDAGEVDSGVVDAGDAGVLDAGEVDSGVVDAGDAGVLDAGEVDSGLVDAGFADAE